MKIKEVFQKFNVDMEKVAKLLHKGDMPAVKSLLEEKIEEQTLIEKILNIFQESLNTPMDTPTLLAENMQEDNLNSIPKGKGTVKIKI